jgi:cell wall assembly regulator SMI1
MTAFSEIINILQAHAESPILNPPANSAEISEVEDVIRHKLPDDVRAAYRLGNGEARLPGREGVEATAGIFSGDEFLTTQEMIDYHLQDKEILDDESREDYINHELRMTVPPDTVKSYMFNRDWIPLAGKDTAHLSIDFDPGPNGVKGQIIYTEIDAFAYYQLGTSFTQFCERLLDQYKRQKLHRWLENCDETEPIWDQLLQIDSMEILMNSPEFAKLRARMKRPFWKRWADSILHR